MLDWLFGKKKGPSAPLSSTNPPEIPPEIADVVQLILAYWTFDAQEQSALLARGIEALPWPELLRLHHLNCLEALATRPESGESEDGEMILPGGIGESTPALERCRQTGERLLLPESPYRPRHASVWQGSLDPNHEQPPTMQGILCNPSLTHLGCLEVLRLDAQLQPRELAFIAFDDLQTVAMTSPKIFRATRLFYDDGRPDEIVFVPLLYATSWRSSSPYLRDGRMTQFLAYPPGAGPAAQFGIGAGQQDLSIREDERQSMFGIGSVAQIAFSLDVTDPRFAMKCRSRGLDPDAIRQQMAPKDA
jgi:hypothetical protein